MQFSIQERKWLLAGVNFNDFITKVDLLDNDILNSNLSQSEKNYLLSVSAIARYSVSYWHDASSNTNHTYYSALNHGVKTPNWLKVGICDVLGGIMGGVWTGGTPIGVVVGAVACSGIAVGLIAID